MSNSAVFWPCTSLAFMLICAHGQVAIPPNPVSATPLAGVSGGGNSYSPLFSGDGRFLVFLSQANNLVTNDNNSIWLDVFLRDLVNATTTLVSLDASGTGGGNGNSTAPVISSNGQFIAFQTAASNLSTNDNNGTVDIYVRDVVAGTTALVSVTQDGTTSGNGRSSNPQITPDGHWVAFESEATNLVAGDVNAAKDVFIRDLQAATTYLVSVGGVGLSTESIAPSLSADGQRIAFSSNARFFSTNLTYSQSEIYVRNLGAGATIWASSNIYYLNSAGHTTYRAFFPVLSANGLFLAFKTELAISPTPNSAKLYYHDLQTGITSLISSNVSNGTFPEMTSDGRFVAYEATTNVYVWDYNTGSNILVSVDVGGTLPANGTSLRPAITSDGSKVAFLSDAVNLATNAGNGAVQLYLRDMAAGLTRLVSTRGDGSPGGDLSAIRPDLSPDGTQVAFESNDENLVADDRNQSSDVFLRNVQSGTTELISERYPLLPSQAGAGRPFLARNCLSVDGRFAAFSTLDSTLVSSDRNGAEDAFVRDLSTGTNVPLATIMGGLFETNVSTLTPVVSANGRYSAFVRRILSESPPRDQIYLRDLLTPTNRLVSQRWNDAAEASARSSAPSISGDGRMVAFQSDAPDIVATDLNGLSDVFVFDVATGSNTLVSINNSGTGSGNNSSTNPVISRDGRWVVFQSQASDLVTNPVDSSTLQLFVRDLLSNTTTLVSVDSNGSGFPGNSPVFDPGNRVVLFSAPGNQAFLYDLVAHTNSLVCSNCLNPSVSADARWLAYETLPASNSIKDIVLMDLLSGNTNLISVNRSGTGGGNGSSFSPLVSYDGQFIAFLSRASDLVDKDTNGWTDMFVRDRLMNTTTLVTINNQTGASANGPSYGIVLGADGRTVLFQSYASDLSAGDFNNNHDIYFLRLNGGDSDGDGMDDDWELAYFGTLARDGTGDFDGDGQSDLQEFLAGTDPTNSRSVFRVLVLTSSKGTATVLWSAVPGKRYQVQFKTNLNEVAWSDLPGLVTATGSSASQNDDSAGATNQKFYRVVLAP